MPIVFADADYAGRLQLLFGEAVAVEVLEQGISRGGITKTEDADRFLRHSAVLEVVAGTRSADPVEGTAEKGLGALEDRVQTASVFVLCWIATFWKGNAGLVCQDSQGFAEIDMLAFHDPVEGGAP